MNDDAALREELIETEMRREMGEISEDEFRTIEADLLARIREVRERREGAGPLTAGGAAPLETSPGSHFRVEASVAGDFYESADAPHTTIVETEPGLREEIAVLDMEPGDATRTTRTTRTARTTRTPRTARTPRTK